MKNMAGRKKPSAEDVVRKLRRADELAAAGKTNEEIEAELQVSPATLHNWRRSYGGMDVDAAKELKELREQNTRLKRLLAEAELEKARRRAVDMPKEVLGMSGRLACKVLGMDNGSELISQALQSFCAGKVALSYIPPGTPWHNGYIESFNNRPRRGVLGAKRLAGEHVLHLGNLGLARLGDLLGETYGVHILSTGDFGVGQLDCALVEADHRLQP